MFVKNPDGVVCSCDLDRERDLEVGDVFNWFKSKLQVTRTEQLFIECLDITEE